MDKDLNDSDSQNGQEVDDDRSLVGKLKKNVSEIISNTPLSKWFRKQNDATPTSSVRRRQEDSEDEEDLQEFQPPTKRTKLPTKESLGLEVSDFLSPIAAKKPLYRHFPEPIAGPSGMQSRKLLNSTSILSDSVTITESTEGNGHIFKNPKPFLAPAEPIVKEVHSDSEGSTSGYSSGRVGSKGIVSQESSKQTSPTDNSRRKRRTLFPSSGRLFTSEPSTSPTRNSSMSSRMPTFDPSILTSSSFVDRTLATKRILSSPFYSGNTIYGGASAYSRNTRTPQDLQRSLRRGVDIKPRNSSSERKNMQLGKTARRILDTLEQFSTPVNDAKKIPVAKKGRFEGILTKYIGANPYTVREPKASTRELQVPALSDSLKTKLEQEKSRLQDSTEAARLIASSSKSVLNNETYQIPEQRKNDKHTSKMKAKISSVRQRAPVDEVVPEVRLNPISLPIKELPKFDITIPPPVSKPPSTVKSNIQDVTNTFTKKPEPKLASVNSPSKPSSKENDAPFVSSHNSEFQFSAPLILAEYLKPLKALNNFKFSEPLIKKRRSIHPELDDQGGKEANKKKNNGVSDSVTVSMDKFKPKEGTWECSVCLIRNQNDKSKCAACAADRVQSKPAAAPTQAPASTFGSSLTSKPGGTWECPSCMIRNKQERLKCEACEEKKPVKTVNGPAIALTTTESQSKEPPSNQWECSSCKMKNNVSFKQCQCCQKPKAGLGTSSSSATSSGLFDNIVKSKPSSSTWECQSCLIRNREEVTVCAACDTRKPSSANQSSEPKTNSFGSSFSKKNNEWECAVCMIRNKSDLVKCQCCETPNPSAKPSLPTPSPVASFHFGVDKNPANTFTFGIPSNSQPTATPQSNAAQIFGEQREVPKNTEVKFSFGIPANGEAKKEETPKKEESSKETPSISLGVKPTEAPNRATESTTSTATIPIFTFGSSKSSTPVTTASSETPNKDETPVQKSAAFSFGGSDPKTSTITPVVPAFSFGSVNKSDTKVNNVDAVKVNPLLKPGEKLPEKAEIAKAGFSFGAPKALPVSTVATPAPVTSTTTEKRSPTKRSRPSDAESSPAKMPTFAFKASTTTNGNFANNTSLFSKPAETKVETSSPAGGFNFSFGAKSPAVTSTTKATVVSTFGTTVTQADSAKSAAPMFKFGSSSDTPKQPTNGFTFNASTPAFGSAPSTTTESKPFAFGSSAASTQPSTFGAPPAKAAAFSFGTSSDNKSSLFSANAPSTENKSTPQFSFGSTANKSQPSQNFSFGQQNENKTPSFAANPFGGAPAQTTGLNGAFNFGGSSATNQKAAGFSFGASSTTSTGQSSGFNFGSTMNSSSPAGSGGFNFSGAVPSFDATAKPSFNFTGGAGITAFSAPPAQDNAPRKIKKAIRRTVR